MMTITQNVESRYYHYKEWYKEMDSLIGEYFDTTNQFENSIQIGFKIQFDCEKAILPIGMTIPNGSKITLDILSCKELEVTNIIINNQTKNIEVSIKSN